MTARLSARSEGGFTILESVIALGIIFGLLLVLLRTFDTGTRVLVETKRQAAASAFASELLERARSLEWEHTGLTADANGTDCPDDVGCADILAEIPEIGTGTEYTFGDEPIVFTNGQAFDPFLSFHQQVTRDETVFDRYLFVTSVRTDPTDPATEQFRRLTAIVRWQSQAGLREEARLVSYVAPFTEPSQPLIQGEVAFDGGSVGAEGWLKGSDGWGLGGDPKYEESLTVTMPDATLRATSDYVSGAEVRVESMSAAYYSDSVGDFANDGQVSELIADDDATSGAPLNGASAVPEYLPSFVFSVPDALRVEELDESGAVTDALSYTSEVWTQYDPLGTGVDLLPYGDLAVDSAARMDARFVEYAVPGVRTQYQGWLGAALARPSYIFEVARHGDGDSTPALQYDAAVNREDDSVTEDRTVEVDYSWEGEDLFLLYDDVYPAIVNPANKFQGWIWIELPRLTEASGSPLEAGEGAWASPGVTATSDLKVHFWDPTNKKYQTEFENYDGIICASTDTVVTLDDGSGGPLVVDIASGLHPNLHYEVQGAITVRPACEATTETYTTGEIATNRVYADSIVTGQITYRVVDTVAETNLGYGELFDYVLTFDAGGLVATALYFDPELS